MLLIEQYFTTQILNESDGQDKKTYLVGVMAEAEIKNRNGRIYETRDIKKVEDMINEQARLNRHILGELDHPSSMEIKLSNVSHRLIEAKMQGNQLICKTEILDKHPQGAIAKSLIDHGVTIGCSTRGGGSVNESTSRVTNYHFVTVDLVATPSCRSAYPESIQEALMMSKNGEEVIHLAENLAEDRLAQKYFEIEMKKFIQSLYSK